MATVDAEPDSSRTIIGETEEPEVEPTTVPASPDNTTTIVGGTADVPAEDTTVPADPDNKIAIPHPWAVVVRDTFVLWDVNVSYPAGALVWHAGTYWRALVTTTTFLSPAVGEWEVHPTGVFDFNTQYYEDDQVIFNLDIWICIEEGAKCIYPERRFLEELTVLDGIGAWFIGHDFVVS